VYLCLAVSLGYLCVQQVFPLELTSGDQEDNPRINAKIEDLMSTKGKPDPTTRRSSSAVWIIAVDKSNFVEPGIMDIFYFCELKRDMLTGTAVRPTEHSFATLAEHRLLSIQSRQYRRLHRIRKSCR